MNTDGQRTNTEYWTNTLRPTFEGRNVIVVGDVIAGLLPRARTVRQLGANSTFMLSTEGMGAGAAPKEEDGLWLALETPPSGNIVEAIHASQRLLGNLPAEAKEALDKYDPKHEALVLGTFLLEHPNVAGRKSLAYRKPEWLKLDDKTIIDSLWDKIGVKREPSEIVAVDKAEVLAANKRLDKGDGVVWAGDSKEGFNGGATGVRWIRSGADVDISLEYFKKHCDRLRVMPFMEGIPCSIHGMVFSDYVAAFRPVEMIVLRKPNSTDFFYAGTASFYDPSPADREYMRATAKEVGNTLRDMVNFRGLFTIDGVMTKDGFRPSELNPRSGVGITTLLYGLNDFPLEILSQVVISGSDCDFKPKELEEVILDSADRNRGGGTWSAVPDHLPKIDKQLVTLTESGWRWSTDDNSINGSVIVGPGTLGSFVRLSVSSINTTGSSFGTYAKDFWRFVDENFGSNIGPLEAAKFIR